MIETFYNTTATIVRRTTGSPTSSDTTVTITGVLGLLRPVSEVARLFIENNIGKEFDFVTDESEDVRVGDDFYISGSKYSVLGVSSYIDLEDGVDSHLDVRLAN